MVMYCLDTSGIEREYNCCITTWIPQSMRTERDYNYDILLGYPGHRGSRGNWS